MSTPVWGETSKKETCDEGEDRAVINFIAENDLWGRGTDRHFTHGSRLSLVSRNLSLKDSNVVSPDSSQKDSEKCSREEPGLWEDFRGIVRDKVPFIPEMNKSVFSLVLGQSIFTPEDITRSDLILNDRPYAGWLYVGLGFTGEHQEEWGKYFDNFELDVGVVGPGSLAEYIQEGWHDMINTTDPEGWQNQLENEPGILLTYERKWRPDFLHNEGSSGLQFDFMPHAGVALGNVFTYGAIGGTLRVGMHLHADYGPPRIRPGVQGSDFFELKDSSFGWYIFAGVEGRVIGRNIFLDGNTYENSHSVDKKYLVGDLQAGLVITFKRVRLTFTNIFRTDEFNGQNEADEFGAISASFRF